MGSSLQNELIGWVESASVKVPLSIFESVTINTANMMFIGAGAFVGLEDIIYNRIGRNKFSSTASVPYSEIYAHMLPEDLVEFGLKPELVGRFPVITYVKPLNTEDLVDILQNSSKSPIADQLRLLQQGYGVEVMVEPGVYPLIAAAAEKQGTGARGLQPICNVLFRDIKYDIQSITQGGKTGIIITEALAKQKLGKLL